LGLEALSRGASFCLFVEEDAQARAFIRRNIEALGLTGVTKIFRRDATDLGPAGRNGGSTLAFLDPPYCQGLAERALASAATGGWLAAGAVTVIEERKGTPVALPTGFALLDQRTWGDTQVLFARFAAGNG
jgi:16S rRNA (guanine966-N2)-methyltransferase